MQIVVIAFAADKNFIKAGSHNWQKYVFGDNWSQPH